MEIIIPTEVTQIQKEKCCMFSLTHMWILEYLNLLMCMFKLEYLQKSGTRKEPWEIEWKRFEVGMGNSEEKSLSVVDEERARQEREYGDVSLILKTFKKPIWKPTITEIDISTILYIIYYMYYICLYYVFHFILHYTYIIYVYVYKYMYMCVCIPLTQGQYLKPLQDSMGYQKQMSNVKFVLTPFRF